MKTLAVIPARYASSRFPGKPLAEIYGQPMIQVVYERVSECSAIEQVCVATDDDRIIRAVESFGGKVVMTSNAHRSGTDRIAEAIQKIEGDYDIIVNVQGDEPGILPEDLLALTALFDDDSVQLGTLVTPFHEQEDFENPNRVKAVLTENGRALYFTRANAPFNRGGGKALDNCFQHVGVYAYRTEVLKKLTLLPPSPLEIKESLEQLRWIENGFSIYASIIAHAPFGIDTAEDLEAFINSNL